ncbi:hypothetical protein BDQ12DRAFT_726254 [Crucibulum laeve]|uniref:Uncharacterized protein n=1 Tax=Crucibulum laeve TaxID=68775 RepID=A0A5C3LRZ3_9AGAR|nr:hypothetical protein BDQ12DRAFT_726254 [Crucibulum laeve]
MQYHICKFSTDVKRSHRVAIPREDAAGFIQGVKNAMKDANIDLVIPMHEEIFYLADAAETVPEIKSRLLSPPFKTLIRLHNKWEFVQLLTAVSLDTPKARLCKSYEDVKKLKMDVEWALKPVFGRASTSVYHLKPGKPFPPSTGKDRIDVDDGNHYIAQEWLYRNRYCSYSVPQDGKVAAFAVYTMQDAIDGTSQTPLLRISSINMIAKDRLVFTSNQSTTHTTHKFVTSSTVLPTPVEASQTRLWFNSTPSLVAERLRAPWCYSRYYA